METEIFLRKHSWVRTAVGMVALSLASSAFAEPSNKWRIQVDHSSTVAGEIELSFVPKGGAAMNLAIAIPPVTHENSAARLIRDAIRQKFGRSVYKPEIDDGEDVLVKAKGSKPDFGLIVVRNTADGLTLNLDRE